MLIMNTQQIDADKTAVGQRHYIALAAILALGLILRIMYMKAQPFYIDEGFNFTLAERGFIEILTGSASESNPPLPVLVSHLWVALGSGLLWLRTMPLLFSMGALAFGYLLGRRLAGPAGALITVLLMAVSPYQLMYAHVFRYPAIAIFLGTLALWLYARVILDAERKTIWLFTAVCVLCLYTHYFFIFLILFFNLFYLLNRNRAVSPAQWFGTQAVAGACFVPWLGSFFGQGSKELGLVPLSHLVPHLKTFPLKGAAKVVQSFVTGAYPVEQHKLFLVLVLAVLLAVGAGFFMARERKRERRLTALALAFCIGLPYLMMLFLGLRLIPMYFCVFSSILYVIIAQALTNKKTIRLPLVTGLALAFVFIVSMSYYAGNVSPPRDNETAIRHLKNNYRDGDILLLNPTYQECLLNFYGTEDLNIFGIPENFDILKYNYSEDIQVTEKRLAELDAAVPAHGRIWAFFGLGEITKPDQKRAVLNHLEKNYRKTYEMKFVPAAFADESGRLYLFEKK